MADTEDILRIENGHLMFGPRKLCKEDQLLCDSKELPDCTEQDGVKHRRTPHRIDFLFGSRGLVVGVESKLPEDLVTSHACRRLARQMRTLRAVVDQPVLLLRDFSFRRVHTAQMYSCSRNSRYRAASLWKDLLRYQQAGIRVMFCGPDDEDVLTMLQNCRQAVTQSESVGAFMGDDRKVK